MSKNYSKQSLIDAVNSNLDSKTAANVYHVPASTIRRHRRNKFVKSKIGRPSYLSNTEESHFVALIQLLPDYGIPVTNDVASKLATDYFKSLVLSDTPGQKWLNTFVRRHSDEIKWIKQSKLERAREEGFTEEVRSGWFETLEKTLLKYNLIDKPNQIFNVDETGFSDHTKGEWVIVRSSQRHAFERQGGTGKAHRTALICVSAGGFVLSPLFLYAGKHLMDSWCIGGPEGAHYGITAKGWMDTNMFEYWLEHVFIPSTSHLNRPLLLILDGYSSHVSLKIVDLLKVNNVICLMLPAHTTHALQPVDIVLFNSVKNDWTKIVKNYMKEGNKTIKNGDFPRLMRKLFVDKGGFSSTRIVSSFARSGIWPFNKNAMREKVSQKNVHANADISDSSIPVPTNILSPSTNAFTIVSSSTNSSSPSHLSLNQAISFDAQSLFNSTINNQSTDSCNSIRTTLNLPLPLQSIFIDDEDIPPPIDNPSYVDLQSCSSSVTFPQSQSLQQTQLPDEQEMNSSRSKHSSDTTFDDTSSPTPLTAVRQVMNEIFSQRKNETQANITTSRSTRGSRLRNTVGLNITEDEYVMSKLKEKEEKKNRIKKPRLTKGRQANKHSTNSNPKGKAKTLRLNNETSNKENQISKDPELELGIQTLQHAIDVTDMTSMSDSSHEEW